MRRSASAWLALLAILGVQPAARAECGCQEEPLSVEQQVLAAAQDADYIALVRIEVTDLLPTAVVMGIADWNPETLESESRSQVVEELMLVAEFEAQRVFRGPDTIGWVVTPADEDKCGVSFVPGETYLIYAHELEDLTQVSTSRCMRVLSAADSTRDIQILEEMAQRKLDALRQAGGGPDFVRAMDLIQAYAGCGDYRLQDLNVVRGLSEAASIADRLAEQEPLSGKSQVLRAELISIWLLGDGGKPREVMDEVLALTDQALGLNPKLVHARVARARAYAKAYDTRQAVKEIQQALGVDPLLESALLTQADIYRLDGNSAKAEQWAHTFIETTPMAVRKANGHEWLGRMRRDIAYHPQAYNRDANLLVAKAEFQMAVALDPEDPWRLINFATFLNEYLGDFAGAESHARKALDLEDIPQARYQLAAARYQALQSKAAGMDPGSLGSAIADIEAATGLALDRLINSGEFLEVVRVRLMRLRRSVHPPA